MSQEWTSNGLSPGAGSIRRYAPSDSSSQALVVSRQYAGMISSLISAAQPRSSIGKTDLDPPVEVPFHQIGTTEIDLVLSAVAESSRHGCAPESDRSH